MRQRCAISIHARVAGATRRAVLLVLAAWLALSTLPFSFQPILAAPPEPERAGAEADAVESVAAKSDAPPDEDSAVPGAKRSSRSGSAGSGSVRPRGHEAPVQLRQMAVDELVPEKKPDDPGDGEPPSSRGGTGDKATQMRQEAKPSRGLRVWPMRADSYSFSQAFGCVPQIAHFYQPGAGCPADAPVIHHGIDMAAPEGTPFYAAASGWVTESGYDREVGVPNTRIIIQHEGRNDGYATEYLHWIASFVEVGDYVEAGEFIGEVGSVGYSTGPHLHFSVIDLDTGGNLDPVEWLPDEAGNEGYRGRQPKERAEMRLPAGTTAGVPEFTDPAPPAPPERDDLRAAGVDHQGRNRAERQQKRDRKERKAAKDEAAAGADGSDETTTVDEPAKKKKSGKSTERTRKRERNKDGQSSEKSARGEDASGGVREKKSGKRSTESSNDTPNEDTSDKRSGKKKDERAAPEEDPVRQRETKSGNGDRERKNDRAQGQDQPEDTADDAPNDTGQDSDREEGRNRKRRDRTS